MLASGVTPMVFRKLGNAQVRHAGPVRTHLPRLSNTMASFRHRNPLLCPLQRTPAPDLRHPPLTPRTPDPPVPRHSPNTSASDLITPTRTLTTTRPGTSRDRSATYHCFGEYLPAWGGRCSTSVQYLPRLVGHFPALVRGCSRQVQYSPPSTQHFTFSGNYLPRLGEYLPPAVRHLGGARAALTRRSSGSWQAHVRLLPGLVGRCPRSRQGRGRTGRH